MKIQIVGLGNVGQALIRLIDEKKESLKSIGVDLQIVSVSDSGGTAMEDGGLNPIEILKYKQVMWRGFTKYLVGYSALDAVNNIECDATVELTPSTSTGEPGLSNIKAALRAKKNVVTANKGPLVVDYRGLERIAGECGVKLLCEATVAGHVPVFCLIESCFKMDELESLKGILNATTNYVIGEMEKDKGFKESLEEAVKAGWAETDCSDDVDGVDSARKLVIIANKLFGDYAKLENVEVEGIRHIEPFLRKARREDKKVKLICEITRSRGGVKMTVGPRMVALDDALATVNQGNMGIKYSFKTSKEIFVSAQFLGPEQTAYAVLNDIVRTRIEAAC